MRFAQAMVVSDENVYLRSSFTISTLTMKTSLSDHLGDIGYVTFLDFKGGSMAELLSMMEYAQSPARIKGVISPSPAGSIQIFANFSSYWSTWLRMFTAAYVVERPFLFPMR